MSAATHEAWFGPATETTPHPGVHDARRLRPLPLDAFHGLAPDAQLAYLGWYAVLAPTVRNTTPQRLRLDPATRSIDVYLDRAHILPACDERGRQAVISLGCVIDALCTAGRCYGLEPRVELADDVDCSPARSGASAEGRPWIGRVVFDDRDHADDESWLQAMIDRKTVRALYHMERLDGETLDGIGRYLAAAHPGLSAAIITDGAAKKSIGRSQEASMARRLNARALFDRELGATLLPNTDVSHPRYTRGYEWGLDDEQTLRARLGLLGEADFTPQEKAAFALDEREMMANCAGVVVLVAPADDLAHRIAAGRAFHDLALHHGRDGFVACIHDALVESSEGLSMLRATLGVSGHPLVVYRVGRLRYPEHGLRPHATRPVLGDVLVDAAPEGGR